MIPEIDERLVVEEAEIILRENYLGFNVEYPVPVTKSDIGSMSRIVSRGISQKKEENPGQDEILAKTEPLFNLLMKFYDAAVAIENTHSPSASIPLSYTEVFHLAEASLADKQTKFASSYFLIILDGFEASGGVDFNNLRLRAEELSNKH